MKSNIARTTLAIIFVVTLCMGLAWAAHAAEHCSNAKTAGTWGLTLTGTLLLPTAPVPGAAVGRVRIDADGNVSGTEARNVGGGFATEPLTGSLTVTSACPANL